MIFSFYFLPVVAVFPALTILHRPGVAERVRARRSHRGLLARPHAARLAGGLYRQGADSVLDGRQCALDSVDCRRSQVWAAKGVCVCECESNETRNPRVQAHVPCRHLYLRLRALKKNSDKVSINIHQLYSLYPASLFQVLFACIKRSLTRELKVAQLAGYVSEHTGCEHAAI